VSLRHRTRHIRRRLRRTHRALNRLGPLGFVVVGVLLVLIVAGCVYLVATAVPQLTLMANRVGELFPVGN
jgi:hypothetical protein